MDAKRKEVRWGDGLPTLIRSRRNLPSEYHSITPVAVIQTFSVIFKSLGKSSIRKSVVFQSSLEEISGISGIHTWTKAMMIATARVKSGVQYWGSFIRLLGGSRTFLKQETGVWGTFMRNNVVRRLSSVHIHTLYLHDPISADICGYQIKMFTNSLVRAKMALLSLLIKQMIRRSKL